MLLTQPGPVTKIDKRNMAMSKKFDKGVMSANCEVILIFPIYGKFGAIHLVDNGTSNVLSLLSSQMDVLWTSVRRTKWYQICPSRLDPYPTSSKDDIWTSKRLHRETCTFKRTPSWRLPDVHWEVIWTSFCSFYKNIQEKHLIFVSFQMNT